MTIQSFITTSLLCCLLMSCTIDSGSKMPVGGNSCANSADCQEGFLCLEAGEGIKECQEAECLTSIDCSFQQYCSSTYSCIEGCESDTDCYSGEMCNKNTNTCESYGCRSTDLDCEIGEFCNVPTGTCIQDTVDRCSLCTTDDIYFAQPTDGMCLYTDDGNGCTVDIFANQTGCAINEVCFPDDIDAFVTASSVFNTTPLAGTCLTFTKFTYCYAVDDCPRGFLCTSIPFSDGTMSDPMCIGDCTFYTEQGYY